MPTMCFTTSSFPTNSNATDTCLAEAAIFEITPVIKTSSAVLFWPTVLDFDYKNSNTIPYYEVFFL